jgi:hypothetical protein
MSFRARVVWQRDPADLGRAITEYGEKLVYSALVQYLEAHAGEIVEQMRREATWQDRTGEARRKLSATVETSGAQVTLYLAHGAPHGIFLEVRWGGRYAIVGPTTMRIGPEIMRGMSGLAEGKSGRGPSGDWQSW